MVATKSLIEMVLEIQMCPFLKETLTKGCFLACPLILLLHLNYWHRNGWKRDAPAMSQSHRSEHMQLDPFSS